MKAPVRLRRLTYRFGYRCLRFVWLFTRPDLHGVKCVLTDGDRVLLVRHTYGHREWDLPGGRVDADEAAHDAAAREMGEELGLSGLTFAHIGVIEEEFDHRRDTVDCFHATVDERASLTIDRGELRDVEWFARDALPAGIVPHAVTILEMLRARDLRSGSDA